MNFDKLRSMPIFSNSAIDWLLAGGIAILIVIVLLAARRVVRGQLQRLLATERTELLELPLEVLSRTTLGFFLVLALVVGLKSLEMSAATSGVLDKMLTIALFWQAGVWIAAGVRGWLERKRKRSMTTDRAVAGSLGIIGFILNVMVWAMVLLLTLDNLGVDITALVAGLGIGGVAVALALQNILGDLFASLSITLDRPFVVGDFLILNDYLGAVEHIGIKSTRLRSLSGEQIVISNADLLGSRIRNYGRMNERRVVFATTVVYETPVEQIERIPQLIRQIVESQPDTRFDRCHFAKHGSASLDFETVYYVLSADYNKYMDTQQAINLRLHKEFARMSVQFAYPTQRILFESNLPAENLSERKSA